MIVRRLRIGDRIYDRCRCGGQYSIEPVDDPFDRGLEYRVNGRMLRGHIACIWCGREPVTTRPLPLPQRTGRPKERPAWSCPDHGVACRGVASDGRNYCTVKRSLQSRQATDRIRKRRWEAKCTA